ncbi:unnamed protein product [marine sediment metagenome]|uniref:Uncharacterized protein n=1 Tax=marine sediment metagenome TaxID=412755 RepID=X0T4N5_9ZZZZ
MHLALNLRLRRLAGFENGCSCLNDALLGGKLYIICKINRLDKKLLTIYKIQQLSAQRQTAEHHSTDFVDLTAASCGELDPKKD